MAQPATPQPGVAWQAPAKPPLVLAGPLASWGSRVGASLVDSAIIVGVGLLLVGVPTGIGFAIADAAGIVLLILSGIAWFVFAFMYGSVLMKREGAHNGQTWGKQMLNIRVTRDSGEPFDLGSAALREIVIKGFLLGIVASFTAGLAYLVDYLWPLFDDENRALHDMLANTHVIQT